MIERDISYAMEAISLTADTHTESETAMDDIVDSADSTIDPHQTDAFAARFSTQPPSRKRKAPGKRTTNGCLTCRGRRKKCDEQVNEEGSCATCVRLKLACAGFEHKRPSWMKNDKNCFQFRSKIKKRLISQGLVKGRRKTVVTDGPSTLGSFDRNPCEASGVSRTEASIISFEHYQPIEAPADDAILPDDWDPRQHPHRNMRLLSDTEPSSSCTPYSTLPSLSEGDLIGLYLHDVLPRQYLLWNPDVARCTIEEFLRIPTSLPAKVATLLAYVAHLRPTYRIRLDMVWQLPQNAQSLEELRCIMRRNKEFPDVARPDAIAALMFISVFLFAGGRIPSNNSLHASANPDKVLSLSVPTNKSMMQWLDYSSTLDVLYNYSATLLSASNNGDFRAAFLECNASDRFIIKNAIWFDSISSITSQDSPKFRDINNHLFNPKVNDSNTRSSDIHSHITERSLPPSSPSDSIILTSHQATQQHLDPSAWQYPSMDPFAQDLLTAGSSAFDPISSPTLVPHYPSVEMEEPAIAQNVHDWNTFTSQEMLTYMQSLASSAPEWTHQDPGSRAEALSMDTVMGASSIVVWALSETSHLQRWKVDRGDQLSTLELIRRGDLILGALENLPSEVGSETHTTQLPDELQQARRLTSRVFREATITYLHSVLESDNIGADGNAILKGVSSTMDALKLVKAACSESASPNHVGITLPILRSLYFPIFICGVFACEEVLREDIRLMLSPASPEGNATSVLQLLEDIWRKNAGSYEGKGRIRWRDDIGQSRVPLI